MIDVLVFSFERDSGSREDCSVFYCAPLIVLAPETSRPAVEKIIENSISFDTKSESYDEDFSRADLLKDLLTAGYSAAWSNISSYVNES